MIDKFKIGFDCFILQFDQIECLNFEYLFSQYNDYFLNLHSQLKLFEGFKFLIPCNVTLAFFKYFVVASESVKSF